MKIILDHSIGNSFVSIFASARWTL